MVAIMNAAPVVAPVASFATYLLLHERLSPSEAFTALTLFNVLRFPLFQLPMLVQMYATVCARGGAGLHLSVHGGGGRCASQCAACCTCGVRVGGRDVWTMWCTGGWQGRVDDMVYGWAAGTCNVCGGHGVRRRVCIPYVSGCSSWRQRRAVAGQQGSRLKPGPCGSRRAGATLYR